MFLQMCKEKQLFVETTSWQKVCLYPKCLDKQESQFNELCGLQQTVTSSMMCVKMHLKNFKEKDYLGDFDTSWNIILKSSSNQ